MMNKEQAIIVFTMTRQAYHAYKREIEAGLARGNYLKEKYAAISALAGELGARFPEAKEDGYFRMPTKGF